MKIYNNISTFKVKAPVLTVGIFDGVHLGHRFIIERLLDTASKLGGESTLLTLWPHPRTVLGHADQDFRLLNTIDEKKELLAETGLENLLILPFSKEFSRLSSCEFIEDFLVKKLDIQHLVVGYNHRFGRDREGDFSVLSDCARKFGFSIEKVPAYQPGPAEISSSGIRNLIREGNIAIANELLGSNYSLARNVVGGSRLGRSIGFPTANITPFETVKLIPGKGVYAVRVFLSGELYTGMLNIGTRPTVNENPEQLSIEVHILDFEKDIYDEQIRIEFVEKLRDEKKFAGIEDLKKQLESDRESTRNLFIKGS